MAPYYEHSGVIIVVAAHNEKHSMGRTAAIKTWKEAYSTIQLAFMCDTVKDIGLFCCMGPAMIAINNLRRGNLLKVHI